MINIHVETFTPKAPSNIYIYIYVYHNGLEWVVISIGQCRYNIYIARYRYRYIHKHMDKIPYGYMV